MNERWKSFWQNFWLAVLGLFVLLGIVVLAQHNFSSKINKGYYLNHSSGKEYTIYINWENAPDEAAFRTHDGDKAIQILKQLQECK